MSNAPDVTYDEEAGRYTRVLSDMYRYYDSTADPIGLGALVRQASCGFKTEDDFLRDDGKRDMKRLSDFSRNIIKLWNTEISPEPYMLEYDTFEEAASAYSEETGIASAIDAHLSGVPIEDLLA